MSDFNSPFRAKSYQTTEFKQEGGWSAGYHTGEDWVCEDRELLCPCGGTVTRVGYDENGYGNYIIIRTDSDKCVLMGHMAQKPFAKVGDRVHNFQKIGIMGTTGNSTGIHLHIEIEDSPQWEYNRRLIKPSSLIDFHFHRKEGNIMQKDDYNDGVLAYKLILIQLKQKGVITQGVDGNGIYGDGTAIATKQVQKAAGLKQTGIADKVTVKAAAQLLAKAK